MEHKLIKLQDKFILVSDEKPIDRTECIAFHKETMIPLIEDYYQGDSHCYVHKPKKIIAGIPGLPSIDFSLLSEKDCKTIGFIDVEKLGFDRAVERLWNPKSMETRRVGNEIIEAVKFGFKTAQSLNDKCFSLEDVIEFVEYQKEYQHHTVNDNFQTWLLKKSLQQTSWDVEVDGDWNKEFYNLHDTTTPKIWQPKITNNSIKVIKIL